MNYGQLSIVVKYLIYGFGILLIPAIYFNNKRSAPPVQDRPGRHERKQGKNRRQSPGGVSSALEEALIENIRSGQAKIKLTLQDEAVTLFDLPFKMDLDTEIMGNENEVARLRNNDLDEDELENDTEWTEVG